MKKPIGSKRRALRLSTETIKQLGQTSLTRVAGAAISDGCNSDGCTLYNTVCNYCDPSGPMWCPVTLGCGQSYSDCGCTGVTIR